MRKIIPALCIVGVSCVIVALVSAREWSVLSGDHFLVNFVQDEKFAKETLDKAEVYYRRIASELGYPRYSEFWTWDKRVKIFIYPSQELFLNATNQPRWSQGMADYTNKQIISYSWSQGFFDSLLPHEIAHLIFRDFVGFKGEVPLWLDEGVAQWAEEAKRNAAKAMAKQLFESDNLLTIQDMMILDIRRLDSVQKVFIRPTLTKDGKKGILILSNENLIDRYYLEAVSLVSFLVEKYGSLNFADFCRGLRDGKTMEEALRTSYSTHIRTIDELEARWREYLANKE